MLGYKNWSEFDGYHDRLSKSGIASEAECIWVGIHKESQFPLLIPTALFNQQAHLLGGSGAGKTGLGLATLTAQLIKQNDGPVIIIDGKGDNAYFQSVRRWCDEGNRKFKWFTTSSKKSTYLFNPFGQAAIENFSLPEVVGFLLLSLNLFHGSGYGRGWFSQASKTALAEAAQMKRNEKVRPATLEEFCKHLEAVVDGDETLEKSAQHVLFMLQTLAEFPQLNEIGEEKTAFHEACENAIDMLEAIKKHEVIYFSFDSLTDPSSAGELSRMVVYSIIAAAQTYKDETSKTPKVTVIVDEAQNIVASNIGTAIEMSRDRGVSFVFSHQVRDQLKLDSVTDLRATIDACTQVKLLFAVETDAIEYVQKLSGEVGYLDATWEQFTSDIAGGNATMKFALQRDGDPAIATVRANNGPRLTLNDIQDSSAAENGCILAVPRKRGLAQNNGAFPIHVDYPITMEQYEENITRRWPPKNSQTVSTLPHWPNVPGETIVDKKDQVPSKESEDGRLRDLADEAFPRNDN